MQNKSPNRNWKRNLYVVWFGCFLTGAAFSLIMPFLPLYVEELGVTDYEELNLWTGAAFSITFLFSAIAAPFWGKLSDRKGRKLMLLRSALGMAIVMLLMGFAQNVWQLLFLRALLGLLGGFVPNANALIATQVPVKRTGWALALSVVHSSARLSAVFWRITPGCVLSSISPPACCLSAFSGHCFLSAKTSRRCHAKMPSTQSRFLQQ